MDVALVSVVCLVAMFLQCVYFVYTMSKLKGDEGKKNMAARKDKFVDVLKADDEDDYARYRRTHRNDDIEATIEKERGTVEDWELEVDRKYERFRGGREN